MSKVAVIAGIVLVGAGAYFASAYLADTGQSDSHTLYGNVDIREVQMAFRAPGRIAAMHYEEGDVVKPGDLLATLDPEPQEDVLAIAQAGVDEAAARLALVQSGVRPQEIEQAKARVRESTAGLDNAQEEFKRRADLVRRKLGNERDLDGARSSRDQWAAKLVQASEALALAQEGFRSEEIAQAQAALAAATARRDQAKTTLEDTQLLAVSGGTVITRVREPGAIVAIGAPVYAVSLTDKTYVRAYVDEPQLGSVAPGTPVTIRTDGEQREYSGQIGFVSPRAEFTPKSVETEALRTDLVYRLRIVVSDADSGLRQGMPVTVVMEP